MPHSIFDPFNIGINPSKSHTVGPMVACNQFAKLLITEDLLIKVFEVNVDLYGTLALSGKDHATDNACVLGLMAETPDDIPVDDIPQLLAIVKDTGELPLAGQHWIYFTSAQHLNFNSKEMLPQHPNAMTVTACDVHGEMLLQRTYFSVNDVIVMEAPELDAN
ncbi:MAG: L-serine dehydratase [Shewanella sp.]|jgi:L-serine dehydratase